MTIIPPPPTDINDCGILRVLRKKSTEHDGAAVKAQQFIAAATPMIDLVSTGPFRQYTLHNRDHAKKLLHLLDHLVSPQTLEDLSLLECLVILYSAFLHDMGMVVTSSERSRVLESSEFKECLREWPELSDSLRQARARLSAVGDEEKLAIEAVIFQLQEAALAAYLRPRHATPQRYQELFRYLQQAANLPDLFTFRGVSFENWLIDICASHNLDPAVLSESKGAYEDRFPRDLTIAQESINTQFCAAVLRITDVLDFDRERTPKILFESLGIGSSELPGSDVSLREWEKHMAIHTIELRADEIVISAECHHPAIEKSIREFCSLIEREVRDTTAVLKRNPPAVLERYVLELPLSVRPRIHSVGYTYKDVALRLNQSAIMSLLMGERLYSQRTVALRELIQNALDACAVRRNIQGGLSYTPAIEMRSFVDALGKTWIEISDNGIGMDEHVLSEYFLKLGDSYYDSFEFKHHFAKLQTGNDPFTPISRFGIGILSVFMLADALEVRTKSAFSPRGDSRGRLVRIEKLGGLAFVAECDQELAGTKVRIRLRSEVSSKFDKFTWDAAGYLRWLLLRPWFIVRISLGPDDRSFYVPSPEGAFYPVSSAGRDALHRDGLETIVITLERWSDRLSGVIVVVFAKTEDGQLTNMRGGRRLAFAEDAPDGLDPKVLIPNYNSNRLTVNGFHARSFRTKNLLRFKSDVRLPFLIDVDAIGGEEVEFDVSRERLTAKGEKFLRSEIQAATLAALTETGVMDRMASDLRLSLPPLPCTFEELDLRLSARGERPDALRDLFDAVARELPEGPWPSGLHRKIAEKLAVNASVVSKEPRKNYFPFEGAMV